MKESRLAARHTASTLTALPADLDRGPSLGASSIGFTLQPDDSFEYTGMFGPTFFGRSRSRPTGT